MQRDQLEASHSVEFKSPQGRSPWSGQSSQSFRLLEFEKKDRDTLIEQSSEYTLIEQSLQYSNRVLQCIEYRI